MILKVLEKGEFTSITRGLITDQLHLTFGPLTYVKQITLKFTQVITQYLKYLNIYIYLREKKEHQRTLTSHMHLITSFYCTPTCVTVFFLTDNNRFYGTSNNCSNCPNLSYMNGWFIVLSQRIDTGQSLEEHSWHASLTTEV